MKTRNRPRHLLFLVAVLALAGSLLAACSDDGSSPGQDSGRADGQPAEHDAAVEADRGAPDTTAAADLSAPADSGSWPPPGPLYDGKSCTLPACDPQGAETVDLSGSWRQVITITAQNCNVLVATMKPEIQPGSSQTFTGVTMFRHGECVYKDQLGGTLTGVIKGSTMVVCEVQPAEMGVTPVVTSVLTYANGGFSGVSTTHLFDVPLPPPNCDVEATVTMTRQ